MKFVKEFATGAISLLFTILSPHNATAATQIFDFSTSLDGDFADGRVATLMLTDLAGSSTKWTLTTNWDSALSSAFVHMLSYTTKESSALHFADFEVVAGIVSSPSFGSGPADTNALRFQTKNNSGRFGNGESVSWNILSSKSSDFSINFLKVNAISNGESVRFAATPSTPVPEPASAALMVAGVASLCALRRRRNALRSVA